MTLGSRGGQTAIAYAPDGTRFLNKRSGEYYTYVVVSKYQHMKHYGWLKWCKSLEEAVSRKESEDLYRLKTFGHSEVVIVECQMVHPWELNDC